MSESRRWNLTLMGVDGTVPVGSGRRVESSSRCLLPAAILLLSMSLSNRSADAARLPNSLPFSSRSAAPTGLRAIIRMSFRQKAAGFCDFPSGMASPPELQF